ncbi:MAG: hypothetical protein DLM54_10195 [Acidimicrobiales bacterium]|nr:MAG: hypothetical protein DLM54_10195 [Acidimicrobiales bacterium]
MKRLSGLIVAAVTSLAACSSSVSTGPAVAITATDTACQVATTTLSPGSHTFEVSNQGSTTTEVYVYAPGDKVVAEKENIGPGTTARFTAKMKAGSYQIACKPGQKGTGIRQTVTVS